jgi:hypothetical protein
MVSQLLLQLSPRNRGLEQVDIQNVKNEDLKKALLNVQQYKNTNEKVILYYLHSCGIVNI